MYLNENHCKVTGHLVELTVLHKNKKFIIVTDIKDVDIVKKYHWRLSQKRTKLYICTGQAKNGGKILYLHNLIMNYTPIKGTEVDHINNDSLDNRRSNLRIIKRTDNIKNVSVRSDNTTSGVRGVCYSERDKVYKVDFAYDGNRIYCKTFKYMSHAIYLRYLLEVSFLGEFRCFSNDELIFSAIRELDESSLLNIEHYAQTLIAKYGESHGT